MTAKAAAECGLAEGTPVVAGGLDAACGTLGAGVIHPGETQEQGGQAGGMSICIDEYKADPRLILGYHVIPGKWLLQGGTTGGGGVMRWFEREFADYERMMKEQTGASSLNQLNEIAEKSIRAVTGSYSFHICPVSVPQSGIHMQKVFSTDLILQRPKAIWYVPAWKAWHFLCATILRWQRQPEQMQKS